MLAAPAHDHAAAQEEEKEVEPDAAAAALTAIAAEIAAAAEAAAAAECALPISCWRLVHSGRHNPGQELYPRPITLSSCRPATDPIHATLLGEWQQSTRGSSTPAAIGGSTSSSNAASLTHTHTRPRSGIASMIEPLLAHVQSFLSLAQWSLAGRVSRAWSRASRLPSAAPHQSRTNLQSALLPLSAQRTIVAGSVSLGMVNKPPSYFLLPRMRRIGIEVADSLVEHDAKENWLVWLSQMVETAPLESIRLSSDLFNGRLSVEPPSFGFLSCASRLRALTFVGEFVSSAVVEVIPLLAALESLQLPGCIMDSTMTAAFDSRVAMDFPYILEPNEIEAGPPHAHRLLAHLADHPTLTRLEFMASTMGLKSTIDLELLLGDGEGPVFTRITQLLFQHTSFEPSSIAPLSILGTHFPSLTSLDFQQELDWPFPDSYVDNCSAPDERFNSRLYVLATGLEPLRSQLTSLRFIECCFTRPGGGRLLQDHEDDVSGYLARLLTRSEMPILGSAEDQIHWPKLERFEVGTGFDTQNINYIDFSNEVLDDMAECMPRLTLVRLLEADPVSLAAAMRLPALKEFHLRMEPNTWDALLTRDHPGLHPRPRIEYLERVTLSELRIGSSDLGGLRDHLPAIGSLTLRNCKIALSALLEYAQFVPLAFCHTYDRGQPTFDAQPVDETYFEALSDLFEEIVIRCERMDDRVGGAHLWGRFYSKAVSLASTSESRSRMSQLAMVRFYDCHLGEEAGPLDLRAYLGVHGATLYRKSTRDLVSVIEQAVGARFEQLLTEFADISHYPSNVRLT